MAVELSDFLGLGTWGFSPWALSIFGLQRSFGR